MEQYYNTEQCPIQPVNRICKRKQKVKVLVLFLPTGHQILFSKICQRMKQLLHVPNIILGAVDDDGEYASDDADDNYGGDQGVPFLHFF